MMLFKIALTCTVCFVFSLILLAMYKEVKTEEIPFGVVVCVVASFSSLIASWFVFCIASIWGLA